MRRSLALGLCAAVATAAPAFAGEAPRVAVDIAPVHSLVARVMQGVGEPGLILPPGASPHGYSMRPSEAALLESAGLVVWVGHDLTPWLENPIETLAGAAKVLGLMDVDGIVTHEFREDAVFDTGHDDHDHDNANDKKEAGHDHDQDHAHDKKEEGHDHDHAHDKKEEGQDHDHAKADEHKHDHGDDHAHHDHAHGGTDPHAWLDPENAKLWMTAIAGALAEIDPEHAEAYRANAEAGIAEIDAVQTAIAAKFADAPPRGFVVFHDAYQYFERRFGVETLGAISVSDASEPSAGRIAELQAAVAENGVTCALAEPQYNPGMLSALFEGTDVTTGVIDPLGFEFEPGPSLYPALLTAMADTLSVCR